jgi:hypothetical protein
MKNFLLKLNKRLEGFRGLIAIWIPIFTAYVGTAITGLLTFSKEGIITAATLAIVPTLKLVWTDAIPKMKAVYDKWLKT